MLKGFRGLTDPDGETNRKLGPMGLARDAPKDVTPERLPVSSRCRAACTQYPCRRPPPANTLAVPTGRPAWRYKPLRAFDSRAHPQPLGRWG